MKLLTEVLIACGVALAVYAARRRIMFALKTGPLSLRVPIRFATS